MCRSPLRQAQGQGKSLIAVTRRRSLANRIRALRTGTRKRAPQRSRLLRRTLGLSIDTSGIEASGSSPVAQVIGKAQRQADPKTDNRHNERRRAAGHGNELCCMRASHPPTWRRAAERRDFSASSCVSSASRCAHCAFLVERNGPGRIVVGALESGYRVELPAVGRDDLFRCAALAVVL